jgi:predicted metal-dependent HD superfamily phosphohydrolase
MMSLSLPFTLPEKMEKALRAAYSEPPRQYHHFGHVEEVIREHASVPCFEDPVATALAVLFHDAVYVPGRTDNEEQSASLARRLIVLHLPSQSQRVLRVEELIRLTARHGHVEPEDVDLDAKLFLDCDMAILGAPKERFDEYDRAIRMEHVEVPDAAYRAGRGAFLNRLLEKDRIFLSELFHERLHEAARANLARALERIESG